MSPKMIKICQSCGKNMSKTTPPPPFPSLEQVKNGKAEAVRLETLIVEDDGVAEAVEKFAVDSPAL